MLHVLRPLLALPFLVALTQVSAQTIPWAQEQPEWVFPLYFEEANGGRDTLYFGIDTAASGLMHYDTTFGEGAIAIDTSEFNVQWAASWCIGCTTAVKSNVEVGGEYSYPIMFRNGYLPLTISWDPADFYDPALPFADQSPAPRAEGLLSYDWPATVGDDCSISFPIVMSDSGQAFAACVYSDSIEFQEIFGNPNSGIPVLSFRVRGWQGVYLGLEEQNEQKFHAFPNPSDNAFNINIPPYSHTLFVRDMSGQIAFTKKLGNLAGQSISVSTANLQNGLYLIEIHGKDHIATVLQSVMHR